LPTYRLLTRREAEADITAAVHWYEERGRGLGREFLRALRAATALLHRDPYLYPPIVGDARRVLLRRFPYALFYEVHGSDIVVLACLHTARDPKIWRERLTDAQ
jgi:toxin ParE1/3/4